MLVSLASGARARPLKYLGYMRECVCVGRGLHPLTTSLGSVVPAAHGRGDPVRGAWQLRLGGCQCRRGVGAMRVGTYNVLGITGFPKDTDAAVLRLVTIRDGSAWP